MIQINYDLMSTSELKQYFLNHREGHVAFQTYLDRINQRPLRITARHDDLDFDQKLQAAIRQKLEAIRSKINDRSDNSSEPIE